MALGGAAASALAISAAPLSARAEANIKNVFIISSRDEPLVVRSWLRREISRAALKTVYTYSYLL
jgi:hypothetical protein